MNIDAEGSGRSLIELGSTLHRLVNELDSELRHSVGLNHFEIMLLRVLRQRCEGMPLRSLTGALQCSRQRASSAVVRMETGGLVSTRTSSRHPHQKIVGLTMQGRGSIDGATQVYIDLLETLVRKHLSASSSEISEAYSRTVK